MLKRRFAFIACGCVLIAAAAGLWRLHGVNRERAVDQFQDHQLHTVEQIAAVLRSELTGSARALHAIAAGLARHDVKAIALQLQDHMQCFAPPCFTGLAVHDARGSVVASVGSGVALDPDRIRASLDWSIGPAHVSRVRTFTVDSNGPALVLVAPVVPAAGAAAREGARAGGFVAGQVQLDSLFADDLPKGDGPALLVVDGRGNVVFRSGRPDMRLNNVVSRGPRCFTCHETFSHVDRMMQVKHGVFGYSVRGVNRLAVVAPFDFGGEHWIAALTAPAAKAVNVVSMELRQVGLVMFATVLALGVAVQVTWRDSRRQIEAEAAAARKAHLERSHAELTTLNAKLESAAIEWRTTVDTIDAAVVVLEPSGCIERMNRAAADTLPGPPFSWLGEPSARLAAHAPWDSALALAREALKRGAASTARVRQTASGRTWDLWCRTQQGRDRSRTVVIVARDVTAVVQLQESLRRSETMAALGLVVAGVAHEVRNPLFAISSLVDAWSLQDGAADPARLIAALRGEVSRLKTLMTELLEYGTPSTSVLRQQPLSLVIDQAIRACAHEAEAGHVRILSDVPADVELWMDARRLVRVFINLVQNAVQHAPQRSDVTIGVVNRSPCRIDIAVRDRGPGFDADDLPRVLTPFFSRRPGGFGLGLAISERIAAEHRGRVEAANHPDGGAVLTVSLPLTDPEPGMPAPEGASLC